MRGTLRRCDRPPRGRAAPRRSGAAPIPMPPSAFATGELGSGLVQRALDQRAVLIGVHLPAENAARREHDHSRDLRPELGERLVVQLLRVGSRALADALGLDAGLRAEICRARLRGPPHLIGERGRWAPSLLVGRFGAGASGVGPMASDAGGVRTPARMRGRRPPKPRAMPGASHARFIDSAPSCGIWSCGLRRDDVREIARVGLGGMLRLIFVRLNREDEVDQDEEREDEALHEANEDFEPDEWESEPRYEEERAHDDEHDLATEHVPPETERQREDPEQLAGELDEPDEEEDRAQHELEA